MLVKPEEISDIIRKKINNYDSKVQIDEVGHVIEAGDGIVKIYGLKNVGANELIEFEGGSYGMAMNLEEECVGCVLFGGDKTVKEGTLAKRTGKPVSVGVSDEIIGRVVNPLGQVIDGKGDFAIDEYRNVEVVAPSVMIRKSVDTPLQTGILAIDAMVPIGRGQRELIIGDRQTGKTAIAVDTILNQKGEDVICIYVAIGQKSSSVASVVETLTKHGALDFSVVVSATASDSASMQYLAPYAGVAIAEYFMYKGKDVLIVYDDLSKHAQSYRAMSLLLRRSPGREAYPGDVFYLHSRLLERAAKLDDEHGGGSITALPIIETLAGDVSAYVPTNVISITDGQIYLESDLFFSGQRPAINAGLSVSRVGGSAQIKAIKKLSGTLRISLAQYRELASFSQFGSDVDKVTQKKLIQGERILELLKQPQYETIPVEEQVIMLYVAVNGYLDDVETSEVAMFNKAVIDEIKHKDAKLLSEIKKKKVLDEKLEERLINIIKEYKKIYKL